MKRYVNLRMPYHHHQFPPDDDRNRVAVVGSKNLRAEQKWFWFCKMLDRAVFLMHHPKIIVRGAGGRGINECDIMAKNWAAHNWYTMLVCYENEQHGIRSTEKRDDELVSLCTHLIAFDDGECKRTQQIVDKAKEADRKVKIIQF